MRSEVRRLHLFELECVQHRQSGQEWVPHWHPEWSFGAVVEGECRCSVDGQTRRIARGDLIAIAPNTVHAGMLDAATRASEVLVLMLYVPPGWLRHEHLPAPASSLTLPAPALAAQAGAVRTAAQARKWLRQALPVLHAAARQPQVEPACALPTRAERRLLERLCAAGAHATMGVSELAAGCGVSRERLHRVVKRWVGLAPSDYLRTARLHRAKALLASTGSPARAAAECGFADQAHFTRCFRKAFGYTPGDWLRAAPKSPPAAG